MLFSCPSAKLLYGGDSNTVMNESMDRCPHEQTSSELEHIRDHKAVQFRLI